MPNQGKDVACSNERLCFTVVMRSIGPNGEQEVLTSKASIPTEIAGTVSANARNRRLSVQLLAHNHRVKRIALQQHDPRENLRKTDMTVPFSGPFDDGAQRAQAQVLVADTPIWSIKPKALQVPKFLTRSETYPAIKVRGHAMGKISRMRKIAFQTTLFVGFNALNTI